MNKAKAYKQLKKKNGSLQEKYAWLDTSYDDQLAASAAAAVETVLKTRTVELQADEDSASENKDDMTDRPRVIRLKYSHPLKPLLSSDNTAHGDDFLPNIQTCFTLLKRNSSSISAQSGRSNRRPDTVKTSKAASTALKPTTDAVKLPNPNKRKAAPRLYSSSSSGLGFVGRKQPSRDSRRANGERLEKSTESLSAHKGQEVHLPAASNMRQLLSREDTENEPLVSSTAVNLKTRPTTQTHCSKKPPLSSNYFLQNYIYKHQKPLKITTSHNPSAEVYENQDLETSKKIQQSVNKRVSFSEVRQPIVVQSQDSHTDYKNSPFETSKQVPLTIKNVELYNSQQKKSQLSAPSRDDDKVIDWLASNQFSTANGYALPTYDIIPDAETSANAKRERGDNSAESD